MRRGSTLRKDLLEDAGAQILSCLKTFYPQCGSPSCPAESEQPGTEINHNQKQRNLKKHFEVLKVFLVK
jgi:hypothetical protein